MDTDLLTWSQRGRLWVRLGIRAAVFHAPLELTAGRGCAYALAVAPAAIRAALQAIDGMRLRPAAIFFQDGNGYREVAL